jgi:hypothetical protein
MSTATQVEHLRTRARQLRFLTDTVGASRALTVYGLAGPDTWIGPTAQACQDALLALRRQLQANQQSLTDAARGLERRADALEQQPPVIGLVS